MALGCEAMEDCGAKVGLDSGATEGLDQVAVAETMVELAEQEAKAQPKTTRAEQVGLRIPSVEQMTTRVEA